MNLMLRFCSTSQIAFLASGSDSFGRALERVADAARRRAVVAVEAGPDAVVAVEVHAPGVAAARIGVRVRAVVGHVPALGREVVERVVRAVRVVRRDQEDVGVLDDVLGRRVVRVVREQPLGGLERDRHRHPLTGVVGRLDEHARLGAVTVLADPQRADRVRPARHLARGRAGALLVEEVGEDDRRRRRRHDARARVGAVRVGAVDQARGARLDRGRDLRRRAGRARPPRSWRAARARCGRRPPPPSGRSAPGRLTISTVMPLPPSCPQAAELTTTADCAAVPVVEPIVACALRW